MSDLTWWDRWLTRPGRVRSCYWRWRKRRLERWAARRDLPPRPATEELLRRIREIEED